ncbi:serine/threonine-protein kinase [Nocardia asteroides]|uniref:serine/threonine-protein kinase n=1 Tax=Nocardia asteroides TaxID=1824 RepID=UPI001E3F4889|nr:serine/threonine-protein kinase [Nocardia asteroides]UGT63804.1 protein kinase [Nocardia asteroides]
MSPEGGVLLERGEVFAGFSVERLLGAGGMGSVYLARQPRMDRLIALKLLNRELFTHTEVRARFEREADLVAQLDHPSIVAVYDRGTEDGQLWISMQYVDGIDAGAVDVTELPPERAVQIIEGVAAALDYAHSMGILHRDVKPGNIMLARSQGGQGERVFLTDFGIARLREDSTHLTQDGMFTATLAYASPEQMTGNPLDHRTDQYSLACALYWLLLGIGPFDSPNPADIIHGHLNLVPAPIAPRRPGIAPAMDLVIAKAMAKHPAHRYGSCGEFAAAARAALNAPASGGLAAVAPVGAPGSVPPGAPSAAPGAPIPPNAPGPVPAVHPPNAPGVGAVPPGQPPPNPPGVPQGASPQCGPPPAGPPQGGPQAGPPQAGPPRNGNGGALPPGPGHGMTPGPRPPRRRGGGRRIIGTLLLGWLVVVVVALLVLVGILFVVLRTDGDEGSSTTQGRAIAPTPAQTTQTTQTATAEADPLAVSRRAFPRLVPAGRDADGTGYLGARCVLVTPDEDRIRFEELALSVGTWTRAWRCDRDGTDPGSLSYVVLQFPAPAAARAVIDSLPAHTRSVERKEGAPVTLHRWLRPDPAGPFTQPKSTARLIVSFGDDPQRAAFLISVANHGEASGTGPDPSAQAVVDDWWEEAPL